MAKPFARGSSSKTIRSRCYQFSSRRSKRNCDRKLRETKSKRSSSHKTVRSKAGTAAGTQEEGEGSGSSKGSLSSDSNRPQRKRKRRRSRSTGGRRSISTIPPRIPATPYPPEQELFLLFFFLAATASSSEYALLPERMGEGHSNHSLGYNLSLLHDHTHTHQQQQQQQQRPQPRARHGGGVRVDATVGEIVEVQGGHIVRSIGRKDRHSKVCTAKGPRDRRVRLSAHTAIQFYDVQDRLGYDRPSKAVDWLIKNAKAAIDELAELPPWSPSATVAAAAAASSSRPSPPPHSSQPPSTEHAIGDSSKKPISVADPVVSTAFNFGVGGGGHESTGFLPPSLDTDSIADTIKSFFPMATAAAATSPSSSPSIGFQTYLPDLPSRTSGQVKDLRLSLQSFQDSIFHNPEPSHHQHHHTQYHESPAPPAHNAHFPASAQLAFDTASVGWAEQSQRIVPWSVAEPGGGGGSGGYLFSLPQLQALPLHSVLGQSQFFSQRGPLQSSNAPAVRAWADPVDAATDHRIQPALYPSISSSGFTSGAGFSGFHIPARFQGEEEHDGITDKPPSASSASRN